MSDTMSRITLARRPKGAAVPEDFKLESQALPTPATGEVLIEVTHLSLDPYMRGRMDDVKSYAPSVDIGGKIAQLGSRLIAGTAKKLSGKFFTRFGEIVSEQSVG